MTYAVFFPSTGAVRLFEAYNLAQATYPKQPILQGHHQVPRDKAHLWYERLFEYFDSEGKHFRHGTEAVTVQSKTFWKPRYAEEKLDADLVAQAFWQLAETCGNKVTKYAANNQDGKKGKRKQGYTVDLVRANEVLAESPKMPTQALSIIRFLTEQEHDFYTRDEVIKMCNSVKFIQAMKTRQDPWRIWRYYTKDLIKLGVLK